MFSYRNISDYLQQLNNNDTSCVEAVQYYLQKINTTRHLNAFVEVYGDECLERAKFLDEKRKLGKPCGQLHGVVIALKDVICYEGHKVSAASKMLRGFSSIYSSTAVKKLLDEDAIVIGNCNCDEFAMGNTNENSVYGRTKNALDENKVPGGSSGGSAVAVQAGLCMVSLGSDTGGSVRQPADFCGIVGMKPSYGIISRHGLIAYASSFDQIGIFGNNVEDVAKVLDIISGNDEYDTAISHAIKKFQEYRNQVINKKPATSELLDWISVLKHYGILNEDVFTSSANGETAEKYRASLNVLFKHKEDMDKALAK